MDIMRQLGDLWKRWQAMGRGRQILWLVIGGSCLSLALFIWWVSQPEYRVLYTGLSAEESGNITSKLTGKGVAYKLAAGGSTILVAADQVMQAHVDLTAEGISGSSKIGKGLDLFDQSSFGSTSFNQHINFLRAQQAELARTIMQIDPIVFARVHIVFPEKSPFIREQKPTTASVLVKLRPGTTLNHSIVAGIASLVAGSVEGLAKESVRIVDSSGRLLSDRGDPESGRLDFMDQRKEFEQYLAGQAEHMLQEVLGAGKAIVRVTVEFNPKQLHEKKEMIIADGRVAKMEKTTSKKTAGEGTGRGGAAGSGSNLGKLMGGSAAGGIGSKTEETQQSDYEYPRTFQEWQQKYASIDRMTIAAFVDLGPDEKTISMDDIGKTIKQAVGFKTERDDIQITQVKMPTKTNDQFEKEWAAYQQMQTILAVIRNASFGLMALCAVPLVWVILRRRAPSAQPASSEPPDTLKLKTLSAELERNPEALANILSRWLEGAESAEQKAA